MNIKSKNTYDALAEILALENSVSFGELIKSFRLCEELSQAELARKVGISKQHLSAFENGLKAVSPSRAAKFAKVLGYPAVTTN